MFGFVIGTLCLVGLVKMVRHGRGWGYGYGPYGGYPAFAHAAGPCGGGGGCGPRGWHGHHGGHGPYGPGSWGRGPEWFGGGRSFVRDGLLRMLSRRLEATPGQERVLAEAMDEVMGAMRNGRQSMEDSRRAAARAVQGDSFDVSALGESFAAQDEAMDQGRKAITSALSKVHDALDPRQRKIFSEFLASGGLRDFGFGGPSRGADEEPQPARRPEGDGSEQH